MACHRIERFLVSAHVKRFLRNVKTRLYYAHGQWTADSALAQGFPDTKSAIDLSIKERLPDVEIVLQMGATPSEYDICVALRVGREGQGRH